MPTPSKKLQTKQDFVDELFTDIQRRAFELERSEISLSCPTEAPKYPEWLFLCSPEPMGAACSLIKSGAATSRTSLKRTPFFKIGFHCRTFSCLKTPIRHRNNAFEGLLASDLLPSDCKRSAISCPWCRTNHFLRLRTQFLPRLIQ